MAYQPKISLKDGPSLDAFSRLRTSGTFTQFDWTNQYAPSTYGNQQVWDSAISGTGSVTPRTTGTTIECSARLSTGGTASGASAIVQTKQHLIYQPGKSRLVFTTFVMGTAYSNAIAEIGYGTLSDGIFLQRSGTTVQVCRRTNVTGTPNDNAVAQSSWNLDKLDGTGTSGYTLDLTKANILVIDLQFLGVGRVRIGFDIGGQIVYCHEFLNANSLSTVYMTTGSLPVRARVYNSGTAGGTLTMDHICSSVVSEGGYEVGNYPQFGISNGITGISTSTTLVPVISIRPNTTLNSVTFRGHIVPQAYTVAALSQVHEIQLIKNTTLGGGGTSWTAVDSTYSAAQYDVGSTTVSGGIVMDRQYVAASATLRASELAALFTQLPIVYTSLNDTQETLTIAARSVTGTGTVYGDFTWVERY